MAIAAPWSTIHCRDQPGAIGNIATEAVVRAPADWSHTVRVIPQAWSLPRSTKISKSILFAILRPWRASLACHTLWWASSVPAKTVSEFIAFAKGYPGKINFASAGTGTVPHVAAELFKIMTSIDMVHVPDRGNALALADLLGGQVQMMFVDIPSSRIQYIRGGTLRAVAMTIATRWGGTPGPTDCGRCAARI